MAWIILDLDETLLTQDEMGQSMPVMGSVEAMMHLTQEGHRLTVHTSRFAPMPDEARQRLKEQLEGELAQLGFPPMEVWTGTTKPDADVFIGTKDVTFDGDWGLALAQTQVMMEDAGLIPQPGMDPAFGNDDGSQDPNMQDPNMAEDPNQQPPQAPVEGEEQ